jgi:hypothetical protein
MPRPDCFQVNAWVCYLAPTTRPAISCSPAGCPSAPETTPPRPAAVGASGRSPDSLPAWPIPSSPANADSIPSPVADALPTPCAASIPPTGRTPATQATAGQSQTGNKPADDFSHTTIFHTKLDESGTARRVGAGLYPKKCPTMILAAGGTPTRAIRPTARLAGGSATTKVSRQRARTWYAGRTPDPQSTRRRLKRGN